MALQKVDARFVLGVVVQALRTIFGRASADDDTLARRRSFSHQESVGALRGSGVAHVSTRVNGEGEERLNDTLADGRFQTWGWSHVVTLGRQGTRREFHVGSQEPPSKKTRNVG